MRFQGFMGTRWGDFSVVKHLVNTRRRCKRLTYDRDLCSAWQPQPRRMAVFVLLAWVCVFALSAWDWLWALRTEPARF